MEKGNTWRFEGYDWGKEKPKKPWWVKEITWWCQGEKEGKEGREGREERTPPWEKGFLGEEE